MIKIIGCGNILRRDDGIGVYVIEELKKMPLSKNVELIDAGTRSLDMISFLEGAEKVIIVDGVKSQAKYGTIYRVDIDGEKIDTEHLEHVSTHELNWEDTLAVGRKILGDEFPRKITFFGIEVENIESGLGLSPSLQKSLSKVVNSIQKEVTGERQNQKEVYKNDKTKLLGV